MAGGKAWGWARRKIAGGKAGREGRGCAAWWRGVVARRGGAAWLLCVVLRAIAYALAQTRWRLRAGTNALARTRRGAGNYAGTYAPTRETTPEKRSDRPRPKAEAVARSCLRGCPRPSASFPTRSFQRVGANASSIARRSTALENAKDNVLNNALDTAQRAIPLSTPIATNNSARYSSEYLYTHHAGAVHGSPFCAAHSTLSTPHISRPPRTTADAR